MLNKTVTRLTAVCISLMLLLGSAMPGYQSISIAQAQTTDLTGTYLPMAWSTYPLFSPFGGEITYSAFSSQILDRLVQLPTKWVHLNNRISWRWLQPNQADSIKFGTLGNFEAELRALKAANMTPIVTINGYPAWATTKRSNGDPSYCGPMQSDKYAAFATFVSQVVSRYKTSEFNVHIWELGNEPDVDGEYYGLAPDSPYGCWGDASDANYGGKAYGEMLKVVTPAIKAVDPKAQVWVGGLLINNPSSQKPGEGRPELFLQGILEAGVGTDYSYFDVLPYHAYTIYTGKAFDYDNGDVNSVWYGDTWGGSMRGKAYFLQNIMSAYGVQKPLFVNEVSLTCPVEYFPSLCNPPSATFLQMQANHLVRVLVRGLSVGVMGYTWYSVDGPGWRNGGLLDDSQEPRPSYLTYQVLAEQLLNANYLAPVDYGSNLEAYAFRRGNQDVHVIWSKVDVSGLTVRIPVSKYNHAYTRDGTKITPVQVGNEYEIPVGFSPTYVIRAP